jgi:hypothetical protein
MTHEEILQRLDALIITCNLNHVDPETVAALRHARKCAELIGKQALQIALEMKRSHTHADKGKPS